MTDIQVTKALEKLRWAERKRVLAVAEIKEAVTEARELGVTWSGIADILGVSPQAVNERFGAPHRHRTSKGWSA